jgi:uncharacterized protein YneF (UPF0154 family)
MQQIRKVAEKLKLNTNHHVRIEPEEQDEGASINIDQTDPVNKLSKPKLLATFLIILIIVYYFIGGNFRRWKLCAFKRSFSTNPPYDDDFYFSLYNHWINKTCDLVPPDKLEF